jgi:hypothetical protein
MIKEEATEAADHQRWLEKRKKYMDRVDPD